MGLDMAMENNLTRRTVLGLFASIPLYLSSAHYAKAETAEINTTVNPVVPFTKENAVLASFNLARSFGKENIDAVNPLPLFNEFGDFIGYAVSFKQHGEPSGYAILDINCKQLFRDFTFDLGASVPLATDAAGSAIASSKALSEAEDSHEAYNLVKADPLLYRIVKQDDINLLEDILDDYTISASYLFSTFDVTYMKTWDSYYGIDQWDFVAECGRYACAVTACYVLLGFLVNYYSPDGRVNKSVYDQLWSYTNTVDIVDESGINAGSTSLGDATKGLANYCHDKYSKHGTYQVYETVTPSVITDAVEKEYGCILSVKRDGYYSHACVIEGYLNATAPNGVHGTYFLIYDGWNTAGRYIDLTPYQDESSYPFGAGLIK